MRCRDPALLPGFTAPPGEAGGAHAESARAWRCTRLRSHAPRRPAGPPTAPARAQGLAGAEGECELRKGLCPLAYRVPSVFPGRTLLILDLFN